MQEFVEEKKKELASHPHEQHGEEKAKVNPELPKAASIEEE